MATCARIPTTGAIDATTVEAGSANAQCPPGFERLFNSAPGLYLALMPDPPLFTIMAASDAYLRATMTRRADILGHGLFEIFPDNPRDSEADGERKLLASLLRVLATCAADAMAVQKYDVRRPADEGGEFEARWWSPLNAPVLDDSQRVVGIIHCVEDVTEVVRLEQEMDTRVARRTDVLHRLAADLDAAENRERRQLARDLHDDLGQTLAAARIRLAPLCSSADAEVREAAEQVASLVDQANLSTRSLAAQLAPTMLYDLGLVPTLEWLGEEVERNFGLEVTVTDDGRPKPLSAEARTVLFRATRELLINVARHAGAGSSEVRIERRADRIVVCVSDAGVGFDPALIAAAPGHGLGLISVRERLSFIGGTAEIRSIPGDGTMATLTAPLAADGAVDAQAA